MMRYGIVPDQRDIVLIPVPFTDLSAAKRRPVVVLSKTAHNRQSEDIIVAAITSNPATRGEGMTIRSGDLENGSLPVDSFVRADKIYTLSQSIIVKRFGRLNPECFRLALIKLDEILGRSETV